jgi:FdhE protein
VAKLVPAHVAEASLELQKLARKRRSLEKSCSALAAILIEVFEPPIAEARPLLTPEAAREKWANGVPLLREASLPLDRPAFDRRLIAVCAAMKQPDADALANAVRRRTFDTVALLHEVLAGRPESVALQAESAGLDPTLAATALRLTALPVLASIAAALTSLPAGITWDFGYCPTCGSWPLLAEARGLEQLRFHRCGWCAAEWEGSRFRCVFCDNQDHRTLGYFHVEGEEDRCRAATCEACRGYVKIVSSLAPLPPPELLVADLSTLHLDLIAAERGFFVAGQPSPS